MTERDADMGVGSVAHGRTYTAEEVARLIPNRSGLRVQSVLNREQLNLTWETIQ